MASIETYKINSLRALHNHVLVRDMNFGERKTSFGLIIPHDDGTTKGIRPRWAEVYATGPKHTDVNVGQYVLVSHGRWTRGVKIETDEGEVTIRRIDNGDILLVSDVPQVDDTFTDAVTVTSDKFKMEGSLHNS
jgi:co-chaperonin GroES (HSP10)